MFYLFIEFNSIIQKGNITVNFELESVEKAESKINFYKFLTKFKDIESLTTFFESEDDQSLIFKEAGFTKDELYMESHFDDRIQLITDRIQGLVSELYTINSIKSIKLIKGFEVKIN